MDDKKFVDIVEVNDYEIYTDSGWYDIISIGKTIPYEVWNLKTESFNLNCADIHIVFDFDKYPIYVKDLSRLDEIYTTNGSEEVLKSKNTHVLESMYDIEISSNEHRYFTNGILSHNSILLGNLASNAVRNGINCAFVSLEMEDKKVVRRIGANLLNVTMAEYNDFTKNPKKLKKALNHFKRVNSETFQSYGQLFVKEYPTGAASSNDIETYFKQLQDSLNIEIKLLIIDYLNIMKDWKNPNSDMLYLKIKNIAEGVRAMSFKHDICVVSATQLNKEGVKSSKLHINNVSESSGLGFTIDSLFGIVPREETDENEVDFTIQALALRDAKGINKEMKFTLNKEYMRITQPER